MAAVEGLTKIPELRRRILYTLGMLAVYRMGCHIPVPGVNQENLRRFFEGQSNTLFGMLNTFSGSALENASIFALGIMPYISASIIFQLLTATYPYLAELQKEGQMGRQKINQYTRYLTIGLALVQGFGITRALIGAEASFVTGMSPTVFQVLAVITLTAGTAFIMWLGEQIQERGIGNGISLIIFAGIAAGIPSGVQQTMQLLREGQMSPLTLVLLVGFMVGVIALIVFLEQGQRRIPIQHAKRQVGRKLMSGGASHIPLKINTAGVIPPIFASSLLVAPISIIAFMPSSPIRDFVNDIFARGSIVYYLVFVTLIVFFCFFYTAIVFNPSDIAEDLKKRGGYVPGIRPGKNTADYIDRVLSRVTAAGALYIALVCLLPDYLITRFKVSFYFGGTTLLILVGVALDTVSQIQSFLLTRDYEGFMKNAKMRGRRG